MQSSRLIAGPSRPWNTSCGTPASRSLRLTLEQECTPSPDPTGRSLLSSRTPGMKFARQGSGPRYQPGGRDAPVPRDV
jgi:hypothetical protein